MNDVQLSILWYGFGLLNGLVLVVVLEVYITGITNGGERMSFVRVYLKSFAIFISLAAIISLIIFALVVISRQIIEWFPQAGPIVVTTVLICGMLSFFVAIGSRDKVG